ncbi:hypothetical protein MLD38_013316 [Melastoma candidum]|uniref:Uncharacterized protein n=1 Tax=Melastoma candidum TaxID=119954 RepID=A0ACB9R965_9MYRT|nr:hypothetical protein MLD38_013316 [Melastoma candidum]
MDSTPSPTSSSLPAAAKYKLKDVKALGRQLLASTSHINNLPLLLPLISPSSPPSFALESLLSLHSFFAPLLPLRAPPRTSGARDGGVGGSAEEDAESVYLAWLRSRFDEFVTALVAVAVAGDTEETLREIVLDTIMEFVKIGKRGKFQSSIYNQLMRAIVNSPIASDFAVEYLFSKYFKYIDVQYFTYISLEKLCKNLQETYLSGEEVTGGDGKKGNQSKASVEHSIYNVHHIISKIPPLDDVNEESAHEMWCHPDAGDNGNSKPSNEKKVQLKGENHDSGVLSAAKVLKKMKLKFTKAWFAFLRLPLPLDVYKEILVTLHQRVLAHMSNPLMLCDFLTRSYDIGGVVSVMALSSLFILMTEHGLEYPDFYRKLYALLQPSIFIAKHRAKFFELLDSCLKSPLLPAYLAAAFTKKLSRLALSVPPPGALIIIALIHNLLRRHPSINCLVHREDGGIDFKDHSKADEIFGNGNVSSSPDCSERFGFDHFQADEVNPIKASAMKSSLWEIDALRHHYCPPVSRFVLSLENDLTVRAKTTEINVKDFSSGSYGTIFGNEMRRRVKQVPLAFYKATPATLFSDSDFAGWTFEAIRSDGNTDADGRPTEENDKATKRLRVES